MFVGTWFYFLTFPIDDPMYMTKVTGAVFLLPREKGDELFQGKWSSIPSAAGGLPLKLEELAQVCLGLS